jgi:hypothetical protein
MASEMPRGLPIAYPAESIDLEVLQRRRSIRSGLLRGTPVPDELVENSWKRRDGPRNEDSNPPGSNRRVI